MACARLELLMRSLLNLIYSIQFIVAVLSPDAPLASNLLIKGEITVFSVMFVGIIRR